MPATTAGRGQGGQAKAMVWVEDQTARIARGEADAVTSEGLHATFEDDALPFAQGDSVAVRIARERGAPTLASTARVDWVRADDRGVECQLVWTAPASERRQLEAWLLHTA